MRTIIIVASNSRASIIDKFTMISGIIAGETAGPITAGSTLIHALLTGHGGIIRIPAICALIIAEQLGHIKIRIGSLADSGFMMEVAELHLGINIGALGCHAYKS